MTRARTGSLFGLAAPLLLAAFAVFWFAYTVADPDLWGHIRFGQDILKTHSVIQDDVYSYRSQPGFWINHEWLSEVLFAAIYDGLGPPGLIAFKVVVSLVILVLCYAHIRRFWSGAFTSVLLLILISVPFRMGMNVIRPQIFTYLCFLLLLLALEAAAAGRGRWLWSLPLLFAAWANLHGGFLAGAGVVGLWIAVRVADRRAGASGRPIRSRTDLLRLAILAVACAIALLLNPYGTALIQFLLRTATVPRPEISEWAPLSLFSLPGVFFLGLLALGIAGLVGSRRSPRPEAILIFGTTAVLAVSSNRHYPLFALTLIVLVAEHVADVCSRWWLLALMRPRNGRRVALKSFLLSVVLFAGSPPRFACIRVEPFYHGFPARLVALLRASGVRGNMAVPFDWGEYVLWHLGPQVKVSIDGRRETVYSDDSYRESLDFEHGTRVWNALLTNSSTDLVLAASASPTTNLLSHADGWQPVYQDEFCTLFARSGYPDLPRILSAPVPALPANGQDLCFPAPALRGRGR